MRNKITIGRLLWATFVFALVAIGISAAYRGNHVAYGLVLSPLVMVVPLCGLALVYWAGFFISRILYSPIHSSESSSMITTADVQPSIDLNEESS